ncbi:hypothetical protein GCM10023306_13910 [Novosphingobium ginsenosidimutans]
MIVGQGLAPRQIEPRALIIGRFIQSRGINPLGGLLVPAPHGGDAGKAQTSRTQPVRCQKRRQQLARQLDPIGFKCRTGAINRQDRVVPIVIKIAKETFELRFCFFSHFSFPNQA